MKLLHLDTNALIALSAPEHPLFAKIEARISAGWRAEAGVVAWHEYVRGPLSALDRERALLILDSKVLDFTRPMAELAARLFNDTGRRRSSTADCLIAASAITANAELVTENLADFACFESHGLKLLRS